MGVCLSRNSAATRPCRKPWADRRPTRLSERTCSSPRTLTNTRAWRRSGLVLTPVTVTNPTRGSWRSLAIASLSTSRTASSTRRMRPSAILSLPTETWDEVVQLGDRGDRSSHVHALRAPRLQPALHPVGRDGQVRKRPARKRGGQRRPLPQVLVVHLRNSYAETAVELSLDRGQLLALALEAAGLREVQVDHQHSHEAGLGHQALRAQLCQASSRST